MGLVSRPVVCVEKLGIKHSMHRRESGMYTRRKGSRGSARGYCYPRLSGITGSSSAIHAGRTRQAAL